MTVTVTLQALTVDGGREQDLVEDGYGFAVRDEALVVMTAHPDGEPLAIYGPGQWLFAKVDRD